MIEAVGHEYLDLYFATIARLVKPGGKIFVQSITVPDERSLPLFIPARQERDVRL